MLKGCVPWPAEFARRYIEAGLWEGITVAEMVERTARRLPQKIAVVHGDERITYEELIRSAKTPRERALAPGIEAAGSRRRPTAELSGVRVLYLALNYIGVIPVMALRAHRHAEIRHFVRSSERRRVFHCRPRGLVRLSPDGRRDRGGVPVPAARGRGRRSRGRTRRRIASLIANDADRRWRSSTSVRPDPADVSTMLLSGGTTSLSKLIPRTHNDYVLNARLCAEVAGFSSDTVFLAILPLGHNYNLASTWSARRLLRRRHARHREEHRRRRRVRDRCARTRDGHRGGRSTDHDVAEQRRRATVRRLVAAGRPERRRAAGSGAARAPSQGARLHAAGDLRHRRRADQHDPARRQRRPAARELGRAGQ